MNDSIFFYNKSEHFLVWYLTWNACLTKFLLLILRKTRWTHLISQWVKVVLKKNNLTLYLSIWNKLQHPPHVSAREIVRTRKQNKDQTPERQKQTHLSWAIRYLSLLAGWWFSSCFRMLPPDAFRAQPPLCLLLPFSDSLLSVSFSHTWEYKQRQQAC